MNICLKFQRIILLMVFFLLNMNFVNAENWMPIKTESGKIGLVDLDSIEKNGNVVKYNISRSENGKMYTYKFQTDLTTKKTVPLKDFGEKKFKTRSKSAPFRIEDSEDNFLKYYHISHQDILKGKSIAFVGKTLVEAATDLLITIQETQDDNIDWYSYFNKQQRKLQRSWHPNFIWINHFDLKNNTYIAYDTVVIGKNGEILFHKITFNTKGWRFREVIEDIFYYKIDRLDPLPKEFKGDKIVVVLKYVYTLDQYAGIERFQFKDNGIGDMTMGKNLSIPCLASQCIGKLAIFTIKVPFVIISVPFKLIFL